MYKILTFIGVVQYISDNKTKHTQLLTASRSPLQQHSRTMLVNLCCRRWTWTSQHPAHLFFCFHKCTIRNTVMKNNLDYNGSWVCINSVLTACIWPHKSVLKIFRSYSIESLSWLKETACAKCLSRIQIS